MTELVYSALWLTLKIAGMATLLTLMIGIPLARWLARRRHWSSRLLYIALSLPMVLPPTAVGYLLLQLLAVDDPTGIRIFGMSVHWLLTWQAAVIASAVMAFPIVLRSAKVAFEEVNPALEEMSRTLGHTPLRTFWHTTLPLAKRGVAAGAILGFTRAASEFGATVTVAGNIPFQTQTLPSAIFAAQQAGRDSEAMVLIVIALTCGFLAMALAEWLMVRTRRGAS